MSLGFLKVLKRLWLIHKKGQGTAKGCYLLKNTLNDPVNLSVLIS